MKKILPIALTLFLMTIILVGCSDSSELESTIHINGETLSPDTYSTYVTDENYEPEEKDLFQILIGALLDADIHDVGAFKEHFLEEQLGNDFFLTAPLIETYQPNKLALEKVKSIDYYVTNKKFVSYDDFDNILKPYSVDGDGWATYEYDTFIEFEFDLERVITYTNGKKENSKFKIEGDFPPYEDYDTKWYIGNLIIEPAK